MVKNNYYMRTRTLLVSSLLLVGVVSDILAMDRGEDWDSPTGSIPTAESVSSTSAPDYEWRAPLPKPVQKNKQPRKCGHAAEFKKQTGTRSARIYAKSKKEFYNRPQIGHAQGYQNHGREADSRDKNLSVIEQAANLLMNVADKFYKEGQIDGNGFLVKKETQLGVFSIQTLVNPRHPHLLLTPLVVIDTRKNNFNKEAERELKKNVERAFHSDRIKELRSLQDSYPEKFWPLKEQVRKAATLMEKRKKEEGYTGLMVYKGSDQSREKRTNLKEEQSQADKRNRRKLQQEKLNQQELKVANPSKTTHIKGAKRYNNNEKETKKALPKSSRRRG